MFAISNSKIYHRGKISTKTFCKRNFTKILNFKILRQRNKNFVLQTHLEYTFLHENTSIKISSLVNLPLVNKRKERQDYFFLKYIFYVFA